MHEVRTRTATLRVRSLESEFFRIIKELHTRERSLGQHASQDLSRTLGDLICQTTTGLRSGGV
jgi:hypothetical protein